MKKKTTDWSWTEISTEEFEKRRLDETYCRIFHKNGKKHIVDYKFWVKDFNDAFNVLNKYKEEHDDNNEYFCSSSMYFVDSDGKHYDSLEEMQNANKKKKANTEDREYCVSDLKRFKKHYESKNCIATIINLRARLSELSNMINRYEDGSNALIQTVSLLPFSDIPDEDLRDFSDRSNELNDLYYKLEDLEYLVKTKHNKTELWSLYTHVLDDLRYNVKKMLADKNLSYPLMYSKVAAKELGIPFNNETFSVEYGEDESKCNLVSDKAAELWKNELKRFLEHVIAYIYFSEHGIVDKKDKDIVAFDKIHKSEIPYVEGTDKMLDYNKLYAIANEHWNAIWDWMKMYGQQLWS